MDFIMQQFQANRAAFTPVAKLERGYSDLAINEFLPNYPRTGNGREAEKPMPNYKALEEERQKKIQEAHGLPLDRKREIWDGIAHQIARKEGREYFYLSDSGAMLYDVLFKHAMGIGSLRRGILICGNTGVGKTTMLKIYKAFYSAYWFGTRTMLHTTAKKAIELRQNGCALPKRGAEVKRVWIEDLGREPLVKQYGNEITLNDYIDELYYDFKYKKVMPLFCTNLSPEELEERYGGREYSRILEMCEVFILEGEDFRTI